MHTRANHQRASAAGRPRRGSGKAPNRRRLVFFAAALLFGAGGAAAGGGRPPGEIDLSGRWRLALDRADVGIKERWFAKRLEKSIRLPGSLSEAGVGDPISTNTPWTGSIVDRSWFVAPEYAEYRRPGDVKVPFWLQPTTYYKGAAWYQREVEAPEGWAGRRLTLFLERPHWETRVWWDERLIGTNRSLSTPHEYDLGVVARPGRHTLTIRVDNRMVVDVGVNSHSVSDHTQGNWNGIAGRIALRSGPPVWIEDLQVYPRIRPKTARVRGRIGNAQGKPGAGWVVLRVRQAGAPAATGDVARSKIRARWNRDGGRFEVEIPLGADALLWDEFSPNLYMLEARLEPDSPAGLEPASARTAFGLREFKAQGTQFTINGRKTFLRGTLECCIFPKTGRPPTKLAPWRRLIRIAKAHGLNELRFHSWCPPEAAFRAADELGMYLHVEASSWANGSTTLGDGKPVDRWIYEETDRILRWYGNHPSFVLMAYGNEPGGRRHRQFLARYVKHYKSLDPRRLWTSGAGWPELPENQWHSSPQPRVQHWGAGLRSRINAKPPETLTDYRDFIRARKVPVVSHEIGQWCVYPNFDEIPKYTGYLKPKNFEIFRDRLRAHGMLAQARDFLIASGKLQALCYKEDIESALRTPGMGGFELLQLHDFPGQGTALVGVLDPFWDEKGYITAAQFRRFSGPTVPLARLPRRVFTTAETLEAEIELAHFGPAPLRAARPYWKLVGPKGRPLAEGRLPTRDIPVDNGIKLGTIRAPLRDAPAPAACRLVVGLEGLPAENDWGVWIYPEKVSDAVPEGVTATSDWREAKAALRAGGKALFLIPPKKVAGDRHGRVALGFSSIFWNTAWTRRQPPHTLGILCDPSHPLFREFPTDFHSNWQWWHLIHRAGAMILDGLPSRIRPLVQVIDDWFTARKLGLVFEARLGRGKLLVCSVDLESDLESDPARRQFRRSLLDYMASPAFNPATEATEAQILGLIRPPNRAERLGLERALADSFQPGYGPEKAADGDPKTMWHTAWGEDAPGFPHWIELRFRRPVKIRAVKLLPRQDGNPNGVIREYAISVLGPDGAREAARGTLPPGKGPHLVRFAEPIAGRRWRLEIFSARSRGPWASLAELELLPAESPPRAP